MKLLLVALLVGGAVFGTVLGLAASMDVSFSTLGSGSGDVDKCGDVTGVTWVLDGFSVSPSPAVLEGSAGDIGLVDAVNIETPEAGASVGDGCIGVEAFITVKDASGTVIASGNCEVEDEGGLGFDEASAADNPEGCTAGLNTGDIPAADIEELVVTMT